MGEVEEIRVVEAADAPRVVEFLLRHLDSSIILLSNIEKAGVVDRGEPLQATYAARFDPQGAVTALAGHMWNGNIVLQGDAGLEQATLLASQRSGRAVQGILGPWASVCRARQALGLADTRARHDERELLFALDLGELVVPELLSAPGVELRVPSERETETWVAAWRVEYCVESLGSPRTPELEQSSREGMKAWRDRGMLWVLLVDGEGVAMTAFNSTARGVVQVGNVYTPPPLRSRGYARAAVAASLVDARAAGAKRSTLFTAESHVAARRAYAALGYRPVGDYGLVLF